MIDLKIPLTLESLADLAPAAFKELASMDHRERQLLLFWLNQKSSSPIGRSNADIEIDKEDAVSSSIKTKYLVPFTSEKMSCNYVRHFMTHKQIDDFFNNRQEQKYIVRKSVESAKRQRRDKIYTQDIKEYGEGFVFEKIKLLAGKKAANDD